MQKQKESQFCNRVLVVGGGMGGIRAALDLAEAGRDVVLIDKAFAIGGLMTQLDRTFPTNNCDLCTLSPFLSESGRQLHIELLTLTQLAKLSGEAGRFTATLSTKPRYINLEKCTACGECLEKFPECVRFTPGLDHRAPTCMRYPQATPYAFSVDMERCTDIDGLIRVCPTGAVNPRDTQQVQELLVGSVVLAPGAELSDPGGLDTYGYGIYPNVVTSMDYERILSASGPTQGELLRPSDGKRPEKIAWLQCVGSRALQEGSVPYCSSACCMYSLKEAMVTRERFHEGIATTIFFMDMRTLGKGYEQYYQRARDDYGVRLIRSRPHSVVPENATQNLSITYVPEGGSALATEIFDLVVLATGFRVPEDVRELAQQLDINLNEHGFAQTGSFDPVVTSRPGVFVCGLFEAPKDIPETMVQASAAACSAGIHLNPLRILSKSEEELPPERDIAHEDLAIGVFICDCGLNIGGVVAVEELVKFAETLPQVSLAEAIGHGCSKESLELIRRRIEERQLNRVVFGACSPRTHETLFQDTLRKAGLNKYLMEMANLRDQDTWVHRDQPAAALQKAKQLISMAVAAVRPAHPLTEHRLPMNKDVLVVGGGVAGMTAALSLAEMGFRIVLVERSARLGGNAAKVRKTLAGDDVQAYVKELITKTTNHDRIQVLTQSLIVDHSGMAGMFQTGVQVGPQMYYRLIRHGITILATGALPHRPRQYLLDEHSAVMTQLDLDGILEDHPDRVSSWENVVMIQCVGSRIPENPNCSRVCCQAAVKNSLRTLELNAQARIYVLYRDMRTPGFEEDYYREARRRGVVFVNYSLDCQPLVEPNDGAVTVIFRDPIIGREIRIAADCLALSTGFIADDEATEDLGTIFRLPRTEDSYFLEDHIKLRPVDLPTPGFFVAGTAHSPRTIRESIAQAQAAAGRAQTFLARDTINLGAAVARVDGDKCAACLICVRVCPFGVPFINKDGYSEIDPAKCHGCGTCASECPARAIQLMQYEDAQMLAQLSGLLERMV